MSTPQPLDSEAVKAANEKLWSEHPELGGRLLTLSPDSQEADYRAEWMRAYEQALREQGTKPPTSGDGHVGDPAKPCENCRTKADLTVSVRSANDGTPIEDATVEISGPESRKAVTGGSGIAEFQGIKPSPPQYKVTASKRGYLPKSVSTAVAGGGAENHVELLLPRVRLFFAIAYSSATKVPDKAFVRAAETWVREVEASPTFIKDSDTTIIIPAESEADVKAAWQDIYNQVQNTEALVVEGHILSHSSIYIPGYSEWEGDKFFGLEFNPGTLTAGEIQALPVLNWDTRQGLLVLHGCNTGREADDYIPAQVFATAQGVKTIGQTGWAYFSTSPTTYVVIDSSSKNIYLWAYRRRKNLIWSPVPDDSKMEGRLCSP